MRILLVTESFLPSVNGVVTTVMRTLEHASAVGNDVMVVCPGPAPREYAGFPVIGVAAMTWRGFRVAMPAHSPNRIFSGFQPDVVHAAAPFGLGAHALIRARAKNIPSVAVFQTDVAGFARRHRLSATARPVNKWFSFVHNYADITLAPSSATLADLRRHGVKRASLWMHGVDAQMFHPSRREGALGRATRERFSPDGRKVVGYVGRLAPEKDVEKLAALAALDCRIVIVGDGPSTEKLQQALPHALFTGRLGGEELAAAYASMDVFVHTGRYETFGLTLLEAMASGVPVVAPAQGGPLDTVHEGINGHLFPPDSTDQMTRAVAGLLADEPRRQRYALAARAKAEPLTWHAIGDQLVEHYHEAARIRGERTRLGLR